MRKKEYQEEKQYIYIYLNLNIIRSFNTSFVSNRNKYTQIKNNNYNLKYYSFINLNNNSNHLITHTHTHTKHSLINNIIIFEPFFVVAVVFIGFIKRQMIQFKLGR
jgi:hypothetical protein